ncbi:MAG TPA: HD domain-containing phosphohydrolase [Candidatus Deferrimicrobium sp.]|nr:HD domain-containing phosphohydrolase [Candidatus Deferrimicrobium sp.]
MGSGRQGDRDAQLRRSREWQSRPALSRTVRVVVFASPVAASFGVAALLTHVLPPATTLATTALSIAMIAAASLVTLVLFERGARRLLPLAALLNLSLIFPDQAPRRFAIARRTGKPRELQESLRRAEEAGHQDDAKRLQTVIELVLALSVHDKASRGHSERVRVFTDLLADQLKVPAAGRSRLRWAALLHDIGKLDVPAAILSKPGKPSEEEWAAIHRHPEDGARLVAPLLPWLDEWGLAVEQHHERFDGTGYPHRLKGHEISLAARIVSVADVYEVMTAPRAYKRSMSVSAARRELVRVAGTQLDPVIVRAFLNISVGRLWRTIGFGAWIAQIPQLGRLFGVGGWTSSGLGMGIATATTATVLAVSGVTGPSAPAVPSPGATPPAVALAPSHAPGSHPPAHSATPRGGATGPAATPALPQATAVGTSPPPSPGATAGQPTPTPLAASPTPTPPPGPTPQPPTPTPTPSPTPVPTPVPTPDPWSCAQCTNTAAGCTSYCNNNTACTTYCVGSNNKSCLSHCFGSNNKSCITYCVGTNNKSCTSNCRTSVMLMAPGGLALLRRCRRRRKGRAGSRRRQRQMDDLTPGKPVRCGRLGAPSSITDPAS